MQNNTTTTLVPSQACYDMHGPYLIAAQATCPACQHVNVLVHLESYASPVKRASVCAHISAYECDDDDQRFVEFKI